MAEAPMLEIENLDVRYRERQVLRGLNLTIAPGAVFGLLGPNGAGKTTLIRTICGRITPKSGSIRIAGKSNRQRESLSRIGLVPQEIALYPHLTVRENLMAFGRLSGLSREKTTAALAWAGKAARLEARIDDRVEILSGGWKRRANIAAAILHSPALLILDEPTVGVDVDARNELHDVILSLSQSGMGVLIATHDLDQAETLCSSVGFLRNGIIDPQGAPRALIDAEFKGAHELVIELRQALHAEGKALLARSGFRGSNADTSWSLLTADQRVHAEDVAKRCEEHGIHVKEIRVREPGLDSLFVHLAQNRPAAQDVAKADVAKDDAA
jgi:ABC-2 type transport system ATP-binding protein